MTEPLRKSASRKSSLSQGSSHRLPRQQRSTSLRDAPRGPEATTRMLVATSRSNKRRLSLQGVSGERHDEPERTGVGQTPTPPEEKSTPDTSSGELRRTEATTSLHRSAQRSPGKTCLLHTSYTSLVATTLAALLIGLITFSNARRDYNKRRMQAQGAAVSTPATRCRDEACRRFGELLKDAIDSRVQPCDDFHAYVCGSWSRTHPGQTIAQVIASTFLANVTRRARDIHLRSPNASAHQTAVQKAARHFVACDNIVAASEDQSEGVKQVLRKAGIAWPSRVPEKSAPYVLKAMFYMSHVIKIPVLLDVSMEHGAKPQVVIRRPESATILLEDVKRRVEGMALGKYERYFRIVYNNFTRSGDPTNVEERFRNIARLEHALISFFTAPGRTKQYENNDTWVTNTANVHHLSRAISKERWLKAFHVFMAIPEKRSVQVVVHAGIYMQRLFSLHEKLGEADFAELYAWLCVQALVPFTSGRILAARDVGSRGSALETHRLQCFTTTDSILHYALEHPYISDVAGAEVQEDVGKLMQQIVQSFVQVLQHTGPQALAKKCAAHLEDSEANVHAELFRRSRPNYFEDVYAQYPGMTLSAMTNWLRTAEFISTSVGSGDWSGRASKIIDANYTRAWSKPMEASYLDVPWYSLRVPNAIKFAGIGSRFFKRLLTSKWACRDAFLEQSDGALDCLANAYKGQFQNFDSIKTDAWDAMLAWTVLWASFRGFHAESRGNVTVLENFPHLSQSALFFIAGCLLTCGEARDVAEARCNLPLRQDANFATAFSCIQDSPMRPRNQCPHFFAGREKAAI
ncbi:neprilysin-1-like [Amblyomma americanum]